ncbi:MULTISPECIES: phage tail protein [unclassified Thalassospira]|uniref:phage tail protein n=1 Tax=unclassified Thalassospira TaxID=2648997 RepID=UPI0025D47F93|nr:MULTISPECIES: phage tail protein [unclassified Thalassospira]
MQGNTPVECEILNVIQGAGIWPDCEDKTQLLQAIEALISGGGSGGGVSSGSEIGSVSAFAMPTPPTGWLVCDGSAISRTEYADLFAAIGTVWGAGDDVTTFNLPDLRGEFVRGFDDGRGVDAGRAFASSQGDEFRLHDHTAIGASLNAGVPYTTIGGEGIWPNGNVDPDRYKTSEEGGNETRPRNVAMTYAIKAFYPSAS